MPRSPLVPLLIGLGSLVACDPDTAGMDSDSGTPEECREAPVVTYANFGESFLLHSCQGCHASTLLERYGAPAEVSFDTVDEAWSWQERVLERCSLEDPTMPPQGGVEEDDRQLLRWWLACGEPGT